MFEKLSWRDNIYILIINILIMKAKDNENLPLHSQLKLALYEDYLNIFLPVLLLSKKFKRINVYDLCCGKGFYDKNQKDGSPVLALKSIIHNYEEYAVKKNFNCEINFIYNDENKEAYSSTKEHLEKITVPVGVKLHAFNEDFTKLINEKIITALKAHNDSVRNLFFIDPYGYKSITEEILKGLLENKKSEIILFLPISHMHRFKEVAIEDDYESPQYIALRNFLYEFVPENDSFFKDRDVSVLEFCEKIKDGFSFFDTYFTAFQLIERNKQNYNALFFISHEHYGLQKFLEVKWNIDKVTGIKSKLDNLQLSLFQEKSAKIYKDRIIENLKIKRSMSNIEMYFFALKIGIIPRICNEILKELLNEKQIEVIKIENKETSKYFYINPDEKKVYINYLQL